MAASRVPAWCGLAAIAALALALRVVNVEATGFTTPYYAAAIRGMATDWHDFLYAAFDPAGFLAVDKPPVALWVQAAAARVFGYGGRALHLPQAIEGVACVLLLHHLVARRFGWTAGAMAALFLALTPLSVAVDRSNNTDACLVLTMLLAAWPLALATEQARPGLLLLAAAVLGVGFNVKMLAAMVVVPGFVALYWVGAPAPWGRRLGHLLAAALVLCGVALSWPLLCEATPADQRPYVDSTQENSVLELAIGHNAMDRFVRPAWRRNFARAARPENAAIPARAIGGVPAGPLRLADPALASQVGWLAPLAVAAMVVGLRRPRLRLPLGPDGQALALWGGWVVVSAAVYSAAGGIFQPYYLAPLGPPLAALAAIAITRLPRRFLLPAIAATLACQASIMWFAVPPEDGLAWLAAIPLAAGVGVTLPMLAGRRFATAIGVAALLAAPSVWAAGTVLSPGGGAPMAHLTARPRFPGAWGTGLAGLAGDARLAAFLSRNRGGTRYLLATQSVRLAAPLIIRTGEPVMAMGGFIGTIPILTPDDLAGIVARGELRYVMLTPARREGGTNAPSSAQALAAWVRGAGQEVPPDQWRSTATEAPARRPRRGGFDDPAGLTLYDLAPR